MNRVSTPPWRMEILDQSANRVVGKGGHGGGPEPETAPEPTGHVVFSPSLPGVKTARRVDPALPGIEAEHDFTEGDTVESDFGGGDECSGTWRRVKKWEGEKSKSCRPSESKSIGNSLAFPQ